MECSIMSISNIYNKKFGYSIYLFSSCMIFWLVLCVCLVLFKQHAYSVSQIAAAFEIVVNILTLIPASALYKKMTNDNRKIFFYLIIATFGILISDVLWYWLIYLDNPDTMHLKLSRVLFAAVPFYTWNISLILFLYNILTRYIFQSKYRLWNIFFWFIIIDIIIVLLLLLSISYNGATATMEIMSPCVQIILFNVAILYLIYAEKFGIKFLVFGFIISIAGNFLCIYSSILRSELLLSYGELFYLLGLLFVWFGIYTIYRSGNYNIQSWVRKDTAIKGKLAFWCFAVGTTSFLLFFVMAYIFSVISLQVFLGLPLFVVLYSVVVVMSSLYLGKYFEMPFKQLTNNINILTSNSDAKTDNNFSTEEFIFLQNYISQVFEKQRESERLKYQLEGQNKLLLAQEKIKKDIKQMIHDITSPISSINTIISKLSSNIGENDRVTLRHAAERIDGIAQRALSRYDNDDSGDEYEDLLVSITLLQMLNEKKEEHRDTGINFVLEIDESARFCFIRHNTGIFKRMLSNLVNNAVDALKNKPQPQITIILATNANNVVMLFKDNGSGMPLHIQEKFAQGIAVSEGKENGHGIGLTQVREAIKFGNGECRIYATDNGTKLTIYFPEITRPHWLATQINLHATDMVVILDDDESIHGAWDNKFENLITVNPKLDIRHFRLGVEVIDYMQKLSSAQKHRTLLLADYELLGQNINGLQVIEQSLTTRAILVTSYATQATIQQQIIQLGIKMLPKELVSQIEIEVEKEILQHSKIVDMVWVDDQRWFIDGLIHQYYSHLKIDVYVDPQEFMQNVLQYPLDTRIILDNYYEDANGTIYAKTGYDLAAKLHKLGYSKLIVFSGEDPTHDVPDYLQVIRKKDIVQAAKLDKI